MAKNAVIPKQKSLSPFIVRNIPRWYTPVLDGATWRQVVRNVPIAGLCELRLINHVRSLQWSVSARDNTRSDKYKAEIEYYTSILNGGGSQGFDQWVDKLLQDALTLPVGGTVEVVRYKPSAAVKFDGKTLEKHPDGHVAKIVNIDGATLHPTGDDTYPVVQRYGTGRVTFPAKSVGRIVVMPRPEITLQGYGMAPPELIYLSLRMVYAGDVYFNSLMSDAPEAGILYLGNVTQDDAETWLNGFRALFTGGGSTFKIPVTYGEVAPQYITFTRPPTEMMFGESQLRYARLVTAAYGLRLSDLGIEGGEQTLAGKIRDQVASRLTGFGVVQTFVENLLNGVLPPYLRFSFNIKDPEQQIQLNRARMLAMQWAKTATDAGLLPADVIRKQLSDDGLFTVDLGKVKDPPPQAKQDGTNNGGGKDNQQPPNQNGNTTGDAGLNKLAKKEDALKSPAQGGRGTIKAEKSIAVDMPEIAASLDSAALVARIMGTDTGVATLLLSAFHMRDGRNDVSNALKKKSDGDPLYRLCMDMSAETQKHVSQPITLYRRHYGNHVVGDGVDVMIPYGDIWTASRSNVRGKAIAVEFNPDELVSIARAGTGFGDPFSDEVVVYGGKLKSGEVI